MEQKRALERTSVHSWWHVCVSNQFVENGRSYFYNKVEAYKDVAKGERAREKSGLSANASEPAHSSSSAAPEEGGSYEDKSGGVCNASGKEGGHTGASDIRDISSEESDVSDYPEIPSPKEAGGLFSGKALSNKGFMQRFVYARSGARPAAPPASSVQLDMVQSCIADVGVFCRG